MFYSYVAVSNCCTRCSTNDSVYIYHTPGFTFGMLFVAVTLSTNKMANKYVHVDERGTAVYPELKEGSKRGPEYIF